LPDIGQKTEMRRVFRERLGILLAGGGAARTLTGLGLTTERAEQGLAAELAVFRGRRHAPAFRRPGQSAP
jgi:hypothetical protein